MNELKDYFESKKFQDFMENGKKHIINRIENNIKEYKNHFNKKYTLICVLDIVDNDINKNTGRVTDYLYFSVNSDKIEGLTQFWDNIIKCRPYDTTSQHFIINNESGKVESMLSYCY